MQQLEGAGGLPAHTAVIEIAFVCRPKRSGERNEEEKCSDCDQVLGFKIAHPKSLSKNHRQVLWMILDRIATAIFQYVAIVDRGVTS